MAVVVVYVLIDTVNIVASAACRQNERKLIKGQSLFNKLANSMQRFSSDCPRRKTLSFQHFAAPTISRQIDFMKFLNEILNIYTRLVFGWTLNWMEISLPFSQPLIVWFFSSNETNIDIVFIDWDNDQFVINALFKPKTEWKQINFILIITLHSRLCVLAVWRIKRMPNMIKLCICICIFGCVLFQTGRCHCRSHFNRVIVGVLWWVLLLLRALWFFSSPKTSGRSLFLLPIWISAINCKLMLRCIHTLATKMFEWMNEK